MAQFLIIPTAVLWGAFVLTIALMLSIFLVSQKFKLPLLDYISDPKKAKDTLHEILQDETQTKVHILITATLDVAFPLSYGFLLSASALRFFPNYGVYLALPAVFAVLADLLEGVIQLLALTRTAEVIQLKQYITPVKFGLGVIALIIAFIGLLLEVVQNF